MDKQVLYAFEHSKILKWPKQFLSSFGSSEIHYYVLSEPAYQEFTKGVTETVVREGKVSWFRPQLLTPGYLLRIEGFSEKAKSAFLSFANGMPDIASILCVYLWSCVLFSFLSLNIFWLSIFYRKDHMHDHFYFSESVKRTRN